jgi:transposase
MSIQEDCWQESIPKETARIGQIILKAGNPYRLLGDDIHEILTLEDFVHLYSTDGRGAVCPLILSLVTLFQFMENLPDREAAEAAVVRLDWKYAMHVAVEWQGFHYSTLCNYRKRLIAHGEERLLFDKVLNWAVSRGFLKKKSKQRTDSTHVLGKVATLSRLELLWETLRMALKALQRSNGEWYRRTIPGAYDEVYRVRKHDWHLNQKEVGEATKHAGEDGFWLLDRLADSGPDDAQNLSEIETLKKVWEQTFTRSKDAGADGGGKVRQEKKGRGKNRITSPHEPEARWSEKRGKSWTGYKLQVTETVDTEAGCTFLTDVRVTPATTHDSEVTTEIQDQLIAQDTVPQEMVVDQGYMSGANMAESQKRGINLFGPLPGDNSGKVAGYRQQDFDIDWEKQEVTCPKGHASKVWRPRLKDNRRSGIYVRFSTACRDCQAWGVCTTSEQGRTLFLNAHHELIAARRDEQETKAFRHRYKSRSAVEGTISTLVRKHGARRARYRGLGKVNFQALLMGAAVNMKQLSRAIDERNRTGFRMTTDC